MKMAEVRTVWIFSPIFLYEFMAQPQLHILCCHRNQLEFHHGRFRRFKSSEESRMTVVVPAGVLAVSESPRLRDETSTSSPSCLAVHPHA
jgi:hypothetical protein